MEFDEEYVQVSPITWICVFSFCWSNDVVEPFTTADVSRESGCPMTSKNRKLLSADRPAFEKQPT